MERYGISDSGNVSQMAQDVIMNPAVVAAVVLGIMYVYTRAASTDEENARRVSKLTPYALFTGVLAFYFVTMSTTDYPAMKMVGIVVAVYLLDMALEKVIRK